MSPEGELRYLILGAQREGNRLLAALLAPVGLTPAQAEVLTVQVGEEPLTLVELGRRLACETGSPSRLVDALVRAGLVERTVPAADRRRGNLSLTPAGVARAEDVRRTDAALVEQIRGVAETDLATTVATLRGLLAGTPAGLALDRCRDVAGRTPRIRSRLGA